MKRSTLFLPRMRGAAPYSKCIHHPLLIVILLCDVIVLQTRYVLHCSIKKRVASYTFMMCTDIYVGCAGLDNVRILADDV